MTTALVIACVWLIAGIAFWTLKVIENPPKRWREPSWSKECGWNDILLICLPLAIAAAPYWWWGFIIDAIAPRKRHQRF